MFSPVGYVPFSHFAHKEITQKRGEYLEVAEDFVSAGAWPWQVSEDGIPDFPYRFFEVGPMDWSELDLFRAFEAELFLSSPRGELVKFDFNSIRSVSGHLEFNVLDAHRFDDFPPSLCHSQKILPSISEEMKQDFQTRPGENALNPWTLGAIRGFDRYHFLISIWYERQAYKLDLNAYRFFHAKGRKELEAFDALANSLFDFQGWAFCVRESEVDAGLAKFRAKSGVSDNAGEVAGNVAAETEAFKILNTFLDTNEWVGVKEELRMRLPFQLKERAWLRVVAQLREHHPHISSPGRRPKEN